MTLRQVCVAVAVRVRLRGASEDPGESAHRGGGRLQPTRGAVGMDSLRAQALSSEGLCYF